ncbi:MAG TPA: DUF4394 domain-containing protein [Azospirillaceae bacterium]|nr:DUF4394 domain-containing protein [Azospirillaceae bacterium]
MNATFRTILLATAALLAAPAAQAASLVALVDGTSIALIDPTSWKATKTVKIDGADKLVGIDVRPADKMLYGVTAAGAVVTIDPATGKATHKSMLSEKLKGDVAATVDFNPAADRLRVMGSDGTSHRANVDDGKVTVDGSHKWKDGDANAGKTPKVVAGAYTNSVNGAKAESTALYVIDAASGTLALQAPPNDGVISTVGPLGVQVAAPAAFNIVAQGGANTGWLMSGGTLHKVDIATGKATAVGKPGGVTGTVTDIAWWE